MGKCPFNCGNIQNLECMVQDQPLRDVEQRLELLKFGVSVRHQNFIVTRPKMNWCFHRCWHKQSQINTLVFSSRIQDLRHNFCRRFSKTLVTYRQSEICILWKCKLVFSRWFSTTCICLFPGASWTFSHITLQHISMLLSLTRIVFMSLLRIRCWGNLDSVLHMFPCDSLEH